MKAAVLDEQGRIGRFVLFSITVPLILGIVFWMVILKLRSPAGKGFVDIDPHADIIWSMYEAALRGDIDSYINCFAKESQGAVRETLNSKGKDAFVEYLQGMAAGIMGISVRSPLPQTDDNLISVPVESVFRGKNKQQIFNLKRDGGAWKIVNVTSPRLTPQPIPYGSNLNE
ncbi:hypothetical protein JXL19_04060 [bacterium]|nr:hypothetical protein [bacterium]